MNKKGWGGVHDILELCSCGGMGWNSETVEMKVFTPRKCYLLNPKCKLLLHSSKEIFNIKAIVYLDTMHSVF